MRRDFERERYDRLYDDRVLVNRSRFAACDRSRPLYELQVSTAAGGIHTFSAISVWVTNILYCLACVDMKKHI